LDADPLLVQRHILCQQLVNQLVRLDEGYFIFRTLRNSPVYLEKRKKDVFAMIRQLGLPTWFGSFSSADTKWNDLLKVLGNYLHLRRARLALSEIFFN
jgi:hypothetical protein